MLNLLVEFGVPRTILSCVNRACVNQARRFTRSSPKLLPVGGNNLHSTGLFLITVFFHFSGLRGLVRFLLPLYMY